MKHELIENENNVFRYGTSQGVPILGANVYAVGDKRDKRLRTSILVRLESKVVVILLDFRYQMLRAKKLDALFLLTSIRSRCWNDDIRHSILSTKSLIFANKA